MTRESTRRTQEAAAIGQQLAGDAGEDVREHAAVQDYVLMERWLETVCVRLWCVRGRSLYRALCTDGFSEVGDEE